MAKINFLECYMNPSVYGLFMICVPIEEGSTSA